MKNIIFVIITLLVQYPLFAQWGTGCDSVNVYFVDYGATGVNYSFSETGTSGTLNEIWGGSLDLLTGLPSYTGDGVLTNVIEPDWNIGNANNHQQGYGYILNDFGTTIDIRDNNANNGELIRPFVGVCCSNPIQLPETTDRTGLGQGYGLLYDDLPEGVYYIAFQLDDITVNGGFNLQYSIDNGLSWANFPIANSFTNKPKVGCKRVLKCKYTLTMGESYKPLELCENVPPSLILNSGNSDNIYTSDGTILNEIRTVTLDNGQFVIFDDQLFETVLEWDGSNWLIHADDIIKFEYSGLEFSEHGTGAQWYGNETYDLNVTANGTVSETPIGFIEVYGDGDQPLPNSNQAPVTRILPTISTGSKVNGQFTNNNGVITYVGTCSPIYVEVTYNQTTGTGSNNRSEAGHGIYLNGVLQPQTESCSYHRLIVDGDDSSGGKSFFLITTGTTFELKSGDKSPADNTIGRNGKTNLTVKIL